MKFQEYLQTSQVKELLARTATIAAAPISIHFATVDGEGFRIVGAGSAHSICRFTHEQQGGASACRSCRLSETQRAMTCSRCAPFLCHLGLGCVAIPLYGSADEGFVATLGPFLPSDAPSTLVRDLAAGLEALEVEMPDSEMVMEWEQSLHAAPMDSMEELALWLRESLMKGWETVSRESALEAKEDDLPEDNPGAKHGRPWAWIRSRDVPYNAGAILMSLQGGDRAEARRLIDETLMDRKAPMEVMRARAVALAAAVLELSGTSVAPLSPMLESVMKTEDPRELRGAVLKAIAPVGKPQGQPTRETSWEEELQTFVKGRFVEGITLEEAARQVGCTASALTRRMQKRFGLSFTGYVGRLRVERAKELLRRTKLTVKEVALRVGVEDASNLAKLFRKIEGTSPTQYRKKT